MSRKSGNRFSEKDMRQSMKLERIQIRSNLDALQCDQLRGRRGVFPPTPCRMATAPQFHCGAVRRLNSGLRSAANLDLICDLVTRPPAH